MKTLTVRLPEGLLAEIDAESLGRSVSRSDVVRERLEFASRLPARARASALDGIADLIGSVELLPSDLSAHKKRYLRSTGYGRKPVR